MPPSTRAARPRPVLAARDRELGERITQVHRHSRGTYGAPRIHAVLQGEGERCGRRRVARLMRAAGLRGRHRRRRLVTTIADPGAAVRPDLIGRDFEPDAAAVDTRWCGDITYIPADEGWLYPATVIDIASRRVVGWATADHLRTELGGRGSGDGVVAPPSHRVGNFPFGSWLPVDLASIWWTPDLWGSLVPGRSPLCRTALVGEC
ncbi:IS3 family transposase [Nonomuraea roseola]|uniref:IS3 family transposase n=1 Tax=Nonomuraea roseola TaxID=46179 RepID=A0ABV5PX90_9ACTN